ncbi:MAG: hypothetical protein ACP5UM_09185 [Anaerolineae bacterium]
MEEHWSVVNAWREVLARVFEGVSVQENVTPSWLTNPETGRRLKLDLLYPEIGLAVRFRGLQGQRVRRLSEEEKALEEQREGKRAELCEKAGVQLVVIDVVEGEPRAVFKDLRAALSAAASAVARSNEPHARKTALMEQIALCKKTCDDLARRIRDLHDLAVYAELWEDRLYAAYAGSPTAEEPSLPRITYRKGMPVWHATYGPGEVVAVEPEGGETYVTVRFQASQRERRFAASLVQDKLLPR